MIAGETVNSDRNCGIGGVSATLNRSPGAVTLDDPDKPGQRTRHTFCEMGARRGWERERQAEVDANSGARNAVTAVGSDTARADAPLSKFEKPIRAGRRSRRACVFCCARQGASGGRFELGKLRPGRSCRAADNLTSVLSLPGSEGAHDLPQIIVMPTGQCPPDRPDLFNDGVMHHRLAPRK